MLGNKRELGFWLVVAGLMPIAYASSYAAAGVTRAEGCSGANFEDVGVIYLSAVDEAPVGADGFFPFRATTVNIGSDEALAEITVEVRDSGGALVPGDVQVLSRQVGSDGQAYLQLGWSASGAAREQGEVLSFHAEATHSSELLTLDRSLTVTGPVPELTLPSFEVTDWLAVKYDAGTSISCYTANECDSSASFGPELRDAEQMTLHAPQATPEILVVWDFAWKAVSGKGTFVQQPRHFDGTSAISESLLFVGGEEEYCARLVARDLHTGETKEQDFCGSPSGDKSVVWDAIANCDEPPDGFLERWCLATVKDGLGDHAADCAPYLDPATGTGGASTGDTGGAGGDDPTPGKAGKAGKGGTGSGGKASNAGSGAKPSAGAPGGGSGGSGGTAANQGGEGPSTAPEGGNDFGVPPGQKRVLTESGCACRLATNDESDSTLGCMGLAVMALGLGARRRRLVRRGV